MMTYILFIKNYINFHFILDFLDQKNYLNALN